ncbi:MAG: N-acetylmuramic acid 6-phosphate etherase [Planctomycetota bacterium]
MSDQAERRGVGGGTAAEAAVPRGEGTVVNRGHLATEQRLAAAAAIDALSVEQTLRLMNTQDMEVPLAVRRAIPALTRLTEAAAERLRRGGRLIYVGAGTSGRLGVLDASECPPTFQSDPKQVVAIIAGGDKALRRSSEGREDDPEGSHLTLARMKVGEDDVVVGIAAGGTTPFVWGAIGYAKERGAATGFVTCVPMKSVMTRPKSAVMKPNEPLAPVARPSLPAPVDFPVEVLVGPEVLTGSTRLKAGTATKQVLNMLTTAAMIQQGKAWGNLMVDVKASNAKLRDRAVRMLTGQLGVDRMAAGELLDAADGRVKVAVVMHKRRVDAAGAEALLEGVGGRLRAVVGPPR